MKISCVIITKNEERNIGLCLSSLKSVADEIIVIDSFSEDNTENICREFNVVFKQVNWQGYAKTKNIGNEMAKYPWILSIDADERLSEKLTAELIKIKSAIKTNADGFTFNRLTNYCGKWIRHCGWYPDKKLRLWKKDSANWTGEIHESLQLKPNSIVKHLNGDLLHYSYYTLKDHLKQIEKYTSLMAKENVKRGKKANRIKLIISPAIKFITMYFFRLGFLDGIAGWKVCKYSAYANYLKYKKMRELGSSAGVLR